MPGSDGDPLTLALWVLAAVTGFSMAIYGAVQPVRAERKAAAEAARRREVEMDRRFHRPGRGLSATSELQGSYFTGRVEALRTLANWLSATAGADARAWVLIGGPRLGEVGPAGPAGAAGRPGPPVAGGIPLEVAAMELAARWMRSSQPAGRR
jgi:hypothetical protein